VATTTKKKAFSEVEDFFIAGNPEMKPGSLGRKLGRPTKDVTARRKELAKDKQEGTPASSESNPADVPNSRGPGLKGFAITHDRNGNAATTSMTPGRAFQDDVAEGKVPGELLGKNDRPAPKTNERYLNKVKNSIFRPRG
jgi:hypothetical protein